LDTRDPADKVLSERATRQDAGLFAPVTSNLDAGNPREESGLPVIVEELEGYSLIRLEGECTLTSAAELKRLLVEGLASGRELRLDLARLEEIDITAMQLLWAAGRQAERAGAGIAIRMSEAAGKTTREAGFERLPGLAVEGEGWPK
jgi:anti-anti-sigma regulatory factor